MRNTAGVFLFISCLNAVQSFYKRPGVNYCTLGVVLLKHRVMCEPLRSLWVLRNGKCREALHCIDGYSKKECETNCINKQQSKPESKSKHKHILSLKSIPQAVSIITCATTIAEIKTTTKQYETSTGADLSSTRETRRPRRTRRTRVFTIKEIC
ncbi:uncharacterized protein LOC108140333 [Drosophila elegans]|uniref:uncharacterized protein LOC108140333 n=1 Tax=Drosophila elegans TaxID=30023 RepID=UPI0007E749FF|nr:uncharacterized protein LOC108140333 [Drosophila elegans]